MPTLALPPLPVQLVRRLDEGTLPALGSAQGRAGRLLMDRVAKAREQWYGHSAYLRQGAMPEGFLDNTPAVVQFPTIKTVQATFTVVGRLEPLPLPDLDD